MTASTAGTRDALLTDQPAEAPVWASVPNVRKRVGWIKRVQALLVATDTLVVVVSLTIVLTVWNQEIPVLTAGFRLTDAAALVGASIIWLATLSFARTRSVRVLAAGHHEYQRVITGSAWAFSLVLSLAFLLHAELSRVFVVGGFLLGTFGLLVSRVLWRQQLLRWRRVGKAQHNTILVGRTQDVSRLMVKLQANHRAGFRVVGLALTDHPGELAPLDPDLRLTGDVEVFDAEDLAERARGPRVETVMIAGELPGGSAAIRRLGWSLEGAGTELILPSRLTYVAGPRMHLRPVQDMPMVHLTLPQFSGVAHAVKRGVDIVASVAGLVLLSPILLAVALAIRLDDRGPVLFRQQRVGANGKHFTMFKFRSMAVDAEARLAELRAKNEGAGVLFKMVDDPRVTRVGKVLRRYSLDELPQLLNTLNGTMSVVGPRPPLPSEVARYDGHVGRRLLTKPGITGLWQVSGRSDLSWEESVRLDLSYVENWSLAGDLVIIMRTFRTVLSKSGAY